MGVNRYTMKKNGIYVLKDIDEQNYSGLKEMFGIIFNAVQSLGIYEDNHEDNQVGIEIYDELNEPWFCDGCPYRKMSMYFSEPLHIYPYKCDYIHKCTRVHFKTLNAVKEE